MSILLDIVLYVISLVFTFCSDYPRLAIFTWCMICLAVEARLGVFCIRWFVMPLYHILELVVGGFFRFFRWFFRWHWQFIQRTFEILVEIVHVFVENCISLLDWMLSVLGIRYRYSESVISYEILKQYGFIHPSYGKVSWTFRAAPKNVSLDRLLSPEFRKYSTVYRALQEKFPQWCRVRVFQTIQEHVRDNVIPELDSILIPGLMSNYIQSQLRCEQITFVPPLTQADERLDVRSATVAPETLDTRERDQIDGTSVADPQEHPFVDATSIWNYWKAQQEYAQDLAEYHAARALGAKVKKPEPPRAPDYESRKRTVEKAYSMSHDEFVTVARLSQAKDVSIYSQLVHSTTPFQVLPTVQLRKSVIAELVSRLGVGTTISQAFAKLTPWKNNTQLQIDPFIADEYVNWAWIYHCIKHNQPVNWCDRTLPLKQ